MKTPTLISERITLRKQTLPEALYSRKWSRNRRVNRFLKSDWGNLSDAEETKFWRDGARSKTQMRFSIVANENGEAIGGCDLKFFPNDERAQVGIMIGEEKYLGKGLGTEVIKILRDYVFRTWKINRLELTVHINNPRAIKCYEKCGFKIEGTHFDLHKKNGKYISAHSMAILKKDWRKLPKIKFRMFE